MPELSPKFMTTALSKLSGQKVRAYLLTVGAALFLSACVGQIDLYAHLDTPGYIQDQAEIIEAADWEAAEILEIDIRQNEFRPALIRVLQGEPYIVVIENRDDVEHFFAAQELFKTSAIRKIVTETEEISGVNLIGINLKPGEVKEVHFVPVRDGWYPFEGGYGPGVFLTDYYFSPISRGARLGMVGSFIVEQ